MDVAIQAVRNRSLYSFQGVQHLNRFPGDNAGGVPPVPIPNTEVKPSRADGTYA